MSDQPETESRKRGRPSTKTDEVCAEIIDRISNGEPLAAICRDDRMPQLRTVYDWMDGDAEFSARIARARVAGFDMIAQEAMQIADTPIDGIIEKLEPNEAGDLAVVERRIEDMLGHRKLQVETRLKLLAKWDPKRYGDRIAQEVSGPDGGSVKIDATVTLSPDEAYLKYIG